MIPPSPPGGPEGPARRRNTFTVVASLIAVASAVVALLGGSAGDWISAGSGLLVALAMVCIILISRRRPR